MKIQNQIKLFLIIFLVMLLPINCSAKANHYKKWVDNKFNLTIKITDYNCNYYSYQNKLYRKNESIPELSNKSVLDDFNKYVKDDDLKVKNIKVDSIKWDGPKYKNKAGTICRNISALISCQQQVDVTANTKPKPNNNYLYQIIGLVIIVITSIITYLFFLKREKA